MYCSSLTTEVIDGTRSLLVITLTLNNPLMLLGWCLAQMSLHAPRSDSPLALLSSFKLFLITVAICGSGFAMFSA